MLNKCRIILPTADNYGNNLSTVHVMLQRDLAKHFGGFTVTQGKGCWVDGGGEELTNGPDDLDEELSHALEEANRLWQIRWGNRAEIRRQANSPWDKS